MTNRLVEFVHGTSFRDLPPAVVHAAKRLTADSLACAVGGLRTEAAGIMAMTLDPSLGPGGATVIGRRAPTAAPYAALINSYLGNAVDADDTFFHNGHHGVLSVFPVLAVAEERSLDGEEFLTSVVLAFEVIARLQLSLQTSRATAGDTVENVPSTSGLGAFYTIGSAAGVGKALGLDEARLASTLGIAAHHAPGKGRPGHWSSTLSPKPMTKYTPYALCGFNAVLAAQLAQHGFTGDTQVLDGAGGLWSQVGAFGMDPERLLGGWGEHWWILDTSIKPYAVGRLGNHAVDLLRRLFAEHALNADDVDRVVLTTFSGVAVPWLTTVRHPTSEIDFPFSLPLALAAAAHGSALGPDWQVMDPDWVARLERFAARVEIRSDPVIDEIIQSQLSAEGYVRRLPNVMEVFVGDERFEARTDFAWGDPWYEETRMTDAELSEKVTRFVAPNLDEGQTTALLETVFALDTVGDIAEELSPCLRRIDQPS